MARSYIMAAKLIKLWNWIIQRSSCQQRNSQGLKYDLRIHVFKKECFLIFYYKEIEQRVTEKKKRETRTDEEVW